MFILHVVHGFPPEYRGGTECYVKRLAEVQVDRGTDARVLTGTHQTAARPRVEPIRIDGLPVYRVHRYGLCGDRWHQTASPGAEGRIQSLFRRLAPDVVHLHHFIRLSRSVVRSAAAAGLPVVWTLHDVATTCPRFNRVLDDDTLCRLPLQVENCLGCAPAAWWQHREELGAEIRAYASDLAAERRAAVRLITASKAQRQLLASLHGWPTDRYTVLPHGALHEPPVPGPRSPDPDGRLRLVHWGSWYRDKGVHLILAALEQLAPEERRRVHLTLYGQAVFPDYGREIETRAAGLPVDLAGPFEPERLPAERFDLMVLPSLAHESHSFVLDEAFRLGLPVFASRIGALPERTGGAGRTFPPGDAAALAACIREALDHPERLEQWRASIPASPPTMAEHAARLSEIYAEARASGPPADAPLPPRRTAERRLRERAVANRELEIRRLEQQLEEQDP